MEYKLIELVVFFVPTISFLISAHQKLINSERSAIEFIDFRNKFGTKAQMLKSPGPWLAFVCFIVSPLYISTGVVWSVLGVVLLLGNIAYLMFHDGQVATPDLCSADFERFIIKRRKQAFFGSFLITLWIACWLVDWI